MPRINRGTPFFAVRPVSVRLSYFSKSLSELLLMNPLGNKFLCRNNPKCIQNSGHLCIFNGTRSCAHGMQIGVKRHQVFRTAIMDIVINVMNM